MRRRVEADHRRLRLVSAREQDLGRLRHELHERALRRRSGVRFMVEEDRFNVDVARDDVVVDRRRVEHRRLTRQRVQHRERIGEERRRERIEVGVNGTRSLPNARHGLATPSGQEDTESNGLRVRRPSARPRLDLNDVSETERQRPPEHPSTETGNVRRSESCCRSQPARIERHRTAGPGAPPASTSCRRRRSCHARRTRCCPAPRSRLLRTGRAFPVGGEGNGTIP